ncbi:MAG: ACT domain-containing protein [Methanomicrobiales archaeon]|nr:ACT domain-containing protein [Methanomicrobiales archaeon]
MTLAALGPEGTISHEVALRCAEGGAVVLLPTIGQIFSFVAEGKGDGIVPIENSESGGIGATLDGLRRHACWITGQITVPVRHQYAVSRPEAKPALLYVHPETHEQCSIFIEDAGIPVVHTASNAESARAAAGHPAGAGAITTLSAASRWGLTVMRADVQNSPGNCTRFVRIGTAPLPVPASGTCSIIVDPLEDRAGLLHAILGVFAGRGINLTRIESRPSRRRMGEYLFFIDADMHPGWQDALADLAGMATIRDLGCYGAIGGDSA